MSLGPFEQLVTEHGDVVMRVVRALLGSATEAEDAWSETFLSALAAYPRLTPGSNVRGWLVTIAHRKAIDQLRLRGRVPVPAPPADLGEVAAAPGPDGVADDGLWAAVAALPFKQRAAVTYHHLGGLPYAAVGELIGSSEAAARRAAADGVAALRRTYGKGVDR